VAILKTNCQKIGHVNNEDLEKKEARPKKWDWQNEACTYWRERDPCG